MDYKLIAVQEDTQYFRWQLKVLLNSLIKLDVKKEDIILVSQIHGKPSTEHKALEKFATCIYYEDNTFRAYKPSSKPHLYGRFWEECKENKDTNFFFIESDMVLSGLPQVELKNNLWHWSDASQWVKNNTYEHILGLQATNRIPGGFHAIGKGIDANFWFKVEEDSMKLAEWMLRNNIKDDWWICEMRAWIWNLWNAGFETIISDELRFDSGIGMNHPHYKLYHHLSSLRFDKRQYQDKEPFEYIDMYQLNSVFSASRYIEAIKDCKINFLDQCLIQD